MTCFGTAERKSDIIGPGEECKQLSGVVFGPTPAAGACMSISWGWR